MSELQRITDLPTLDKLCEEAEDFLYDAITYMRDDMGVWWALARAETTAGCVETWFTVNETLSERLNDQHADLVEAMGGRS